MLYDRVCSLVVGKQGGSGTEIKNLRIVFNIQKGSVRTPNKCTCKIYNAKKETRSQVEAIGNVLILKAGYKDDIGLITIFSGNVTRSISYKEGPNWITELEMLDGFEEFRDRKITISMAKGITTTQVIKEIVKGFRLPVRKFPTGFVDKVYKSGFSFVGRCRDGMDKACDYAGLEWSIQNREVQIIKKGGTLQEKAYVLSAGTGLIGSPQQESQTLTEKAAAEIGYTTGQPGTLKEYELNREGEFDVMLRITGYKVISLMLPTIEPGAYLKLDSQAVKGFFRVEQLNHVGDTHSQDWHTECLLRYTKDSQKADWTTNSKIR